MRYSLPLLFFAFTLLLLASQAQLASSSSCALRISFIKSSERGWLVLIAYEAGGYTRTCRGIVEPNPFYIQTKAINAYLLAVPLYYIVESVCGDAAWLVEDMSGRDCNITVTLDAPRGFLVRTAMDWRGFGRLGGPYTLSARLFARYYVYDAITVIDSRLFNVVDANGYSLVYEHGTGREARLASSIFACVKETVEKLLGPSPRSPVLLVVTRSAHPLYPPGFGQSTGAMVYLKLGGDRAWIIHTVAHEVLHGWLNYGLLSGGFGVQEAIAEFMSLRALAACNDTWYKLAAEYSSSLAAVGEDYALWSRLHERIWRLALNLCKRDVYTDALRRLFQEALAKPNGLDIDLFHFVETIVKTAPLYCRNVLAERLAVLLPEEFRLNTSNANNVTASTRSMIVCNVHKQPSFKTITLLTTVTITETKTVATPCLESNLIDILTWIAIVVIAGVSAYLLASRAKRIM